MRCDECITDKTFCSSCTANPTHRNYFKAYIEVCPKGYIGCINDPAYTKCYHPETYKRLYGNLTPEEVIIKHGCMDYSKDAKDYDANYCEFYDDEDK